MNQPRYRAMAQSFKPSLNLPIEAQCIKLGVNGISGCGFFDIWHKEVREILTEAGYSIEDAMQIECKCGNELEKQLKEKEIERVKDTYRGTSRRFTFEQEHARGQTEQDDYRRGRRL